MVVLLNVMRKLVSVSVFHQKTYLDAEVQQRAYNAKKITTAAFVLLNQLAHVIALMDLQRTVDWIRLVVQFGGVGRVTQVSKHKF